MASNFNLVNLYDYQQAALRTWKSFDTREIDGPTMELLHSALLIADEAGELVSPIKKYVIYNKPLDIENVKEELGDLMYGIVVMADTLGIDIKEILFNNIDKLKQRYPEGYSDEDAVLRRDKQKEG